MSSENGWGWFCLTMTTQMIEESEIHWAGSQAGGSLGNAFVFANHE